MNFYQRNIWDDTEYTCELTDMLDVLGNLTVIEKTGLYRHYIYISLSNVESKCLPIRVPGGTVGALWFDDNLRITNIYVDTNYVVKTYPSNVNELVQVYVGKLIKLP